jgi:hypothetical protein
MLTNPTIETLKSLKLHGITSIQSLIERGLSAFAFQETLVDQE